MAKVYVLREEDLQKIDRLLYSPTTYGGETPDDSIMNFDKFCNHDDGFMCECRRKKLLEFIEEKEVT